MLGKKDRWQGDLFVACGLRELVPDDHILKCVDKVLDLSWLREEVKDCYCLDNGRPGIDPEAAVRLMLAGFFQGITKDRKLLREAQVNLAIRWFAGYRLHEDLPHHSTLTKIRQRWGPERFKKIFERTVQACVDADLVSGETVHVDATLIRADVSWSSLTERHAEQVIAENADADPPSDPADNGDKPKRGRRRTRDKKPKKISRTDPDATLSTSSREERMEPCFKQHTAVDDKAGVVVDVAATTGEASEGKELMGQIARVEARLECELDTVTADAGYAHAENYGELELAGIEAVIPPPPEPRSKKRYPSRRFTYDALHDVVRCPRRRVLRSSHRQANGWIYRARTKDCKRCPLRAECVGRGQSSRTLYISNNHTALVRARRDRLRWDEAKRRWYARHRWRVEGAHGEAKTQHGLRRAARRGLANVAIQIYLTAAVMNLKRLAGALLREIRRLRPVRWPSGVHGTPTRGSAACLGADAARIRRTRRAA